MRLGIEIQSHHILAALIKRRGEHWELIRVFKKSRENGLCELKAQLPRFGVKTIVGVPRKNIHVKEIALDENLKLSEIEFYLQANFSKLFPELSKEGYFDFEIVSSSRGKNIRVMGIDKKSLNDFIAPFKKFRVIAVDVDELAKNRGFVQIARLADPEFITALGLALWEPSNEY